jgi:hypothetical protein
VIAISAVLTVRWCQVVLYLGPLMLQLRGGALVCVFEYFQWHSFVPGAYMSSFSSHEQRIMMWRMFAFAPRLEADESFFCVQLPLWIPFAGIAIPTAWLFWLGRRRPAPGACRCGYDLTGNTSGRCPECGQRAPLSS